MLTKEAPLCNPTQVTECIALKGMLQRTMKTRIKKHKARQESQGADFGKLLKECRTERALSLRALAKMTWMCYQHVYEMERGVRVCGAGPAERLSQALGLTGAKESQFLYAAADTCKSERIIKRSQNFPPVVLDALAAKLRDMGISADDIQRVEPAAADPRSSGMDLKIKLTSGDTYVVAVLVKRMAEE